MQEITRKNQENEKEQQQLDGGYRASRGKSVGASVQTEINC